MWERYYNLLSIINFHILLSKMLIKTSLQRRTANFDTFQIKSFPCNVECPEFQSVIEASFNAELTFAFDELGVLLLQALELRLPLHLEPLLPIPVGLIADWSFPGVGRTRQYTQDQNRGQQPSYGHYTCVVSLHTVRITSLDPAVRSQALAASGTHDLLDL